ncbi:CLIP domain-containing serine protease 14D-like [Anopheles funestus]|uniref:CLIP domain-containing serine protease 14D-like n=1 Tax=Anopheles funestus TaxID=62324 RepID=UPI0020C5CB4F|nr:CLIP domain-containing serine protease 14D-like [Anopheles funestus]
MFRARLSVCAVFTFVLPLLVVLVQGQRSMKGKACILMTGEPGRCIRLEDCTAIAALVNRSVRYPSDSEKIRAVFGACESDESASDPIVCCKTPTLSPTRRRVVTSTAASIPITRTRPTRARATTISTTTVRTRPVIKYDNFREVLPPYCGIKNQLGNNVYFGAEDNDNVHSWAVYLEIRKPNSNRPGRCVGTFIQENFVLTAAHCLHNLAKENVKLFFGVTKLSKLEQCLIMNECEERAAAEVIIHENYNFHARTNDIALIRLNNSIDIMGEIAPACLPLNYTFDESLANDRRVVSFGWGENEHGTMSDTKGIVMLNVVPQAECEDYLKRQKRFNASMIYSVMCTNSEIAGQDVCEGDSGAPMLQLREKQYFVVGVVSFGPKCGANIAPGISLRVSEYIGWILLNMKRSELLAEN